MKIALCFSGAIRSFNTCIPSLYNYFINSFDEVDIFLYLVYINDSNKIDNNFKMRNSNSDINNIINILKPKDYVIKEYNNDYQIKEMTINKINYLKTNFRDYAKDKNWKKRDINDINKYAYNSFGMFYKIYKCNELKSNYENKHNFKYDMVWRCRLDYIFLDYIDITFNKKTIYMIEDRYAHHNKKTLKYTNDKFICSDSETMDKIANLYNKLPKYLQQGVQFDGSSLMIHHIKSLIKDYNFKLIGNENTYYKCQGRHNIKPINRKILIDLNDKRLLYELSYYLLYQKYSIISEFKNDILELFEGYSNDLQDNYYYIITDYKNDIKCDNKIYLNLKNENCISINHNNEDYLIKFIFYIIRFNNQKKEYNLDEIDNNIKLNSFVRFIIPDRGFYNGEIINIKDNHYIIKHGSKNFTVLKSYCCLLKYDI